LQFVEDQDQKKKGQSTSNLIGNWSQTPSTQISRQGGAWIFSPIGFLTDWTGNNRRPGV
jgi:hypothetical protein